MAEISRRHTSVIMTHWAMNEFRSETMKKSVQSLIDTTSNSKIIIVDNGGNVEDSKWLLEKTDKKEISCYIRNRNNMSFGYGRNQGLKLCSGDYIVISDNDILFEQGWLEECIEFLEKHKGKYLATPLVPDRMKRQKKYIMGEIDGWQLNMRAGSNCWVMSRKAFEDIGYFIIHRIAGSYWNDKFIRIGYLMVCMPVAKAKDIGFEKGYNFKAQIENFEL